MRRDTAGDLSEFLPNDLGDLTDLQKAIPRIAKDERLAAIIEQALPSIPTKHDLYLGDARDMPSLAPNSVHLVLASPPYSTAWLDHLGILCKWPLS